MNSCLFVQWKKPTDASRFVIDGNVSEYSGTELQDFVMRLFANIPKYKEIFSNQERQDLSPSFRISFNDTWCFVEGNFEETDMSGRKLVYIFATKESDSNVIAKILQDYAALLGVTTHAEDIEEIIKHEIKKKPLIKKSTLCVIIAIIILLLLFMLQNLLNKPLTTNGIQEQMDSIKTLSY